MLIINKIIKIGICLAALVLPFVSLAARRIEYNNMIFDLPYINDPYHFTPESRLVGILFAGDEPKDYMIPTSVNYYSRDYPLTGIDGYAFENVKARKIQIPACVSQIEDYTFFRAAFSDLVFEKDGNGESQIKYINKYAFVGSKSNGTFCVPSSVEYLGFTECYFKKIVFDDECCVAVSNETFSECVVDSLYIGNKMTISERSRSNEKVDNRSNPFVDLTVKHISFPIDMTSQESITKISGYFEGCNVLESIEFRPVNSDWIYYSPVIFPVLSGVNKLKSLTIPEGFTKCVILPYVDEINLPDSMEEICSLAKSPLKSFVWGANLKIVNGRGFNIALEALYMKPLLPPDKCPDFDSTIYENTNLYVPHGTIDAYRNHDVWGKFRYIEEFDPNNFSAVTELPVENYADNTEKYFSLDGKLLPVKPTQRGIYICVQRGKTTKFIVK